MTFHIHSGHYLLLLYFRDIIYQENNIFFFVKSQLILTRIHHDNIGSGKYCISSKACSEVKLYGKLKFIQIDPFITISFYYECVIDYHGNLSLKNNNNAKENYLISIFS